MTVRGRARSRRCKDIYHGENFLQALERAFARKRFGRWQRREGRLVELFGEHAGEEVGGAGGCGGFGGAE